MTRAERLALLGPETVAEIDRLVAEAPDPPLELIEELRPLLSSALQRYRARAAAESTQQAAA